MKSSIKEGISRSREQAQVINLDLEEGDRQVRLLPCDIGFFVITQRKILRLRSASDIDPDNQYPETPWEQCEVLSFGASDEIVNDTIIYTQEIMDRRCPISEMERNALTNISWEVMESLISLRSIKDDFEKDQVAVFNIIDSDFEAFAKHAKKAIPTVSNCGVRVRSFFVYVRLCLDSISSLFDALTELKFGKGHRLFPKNCNKFAKGYFDNALIWIKAEREDQADLINILENNVQWIKTWIDARNAAVHPRKNNYIEIINFSLEASGKITFPKWALIHDAYPDFQSSDILRSFEKVIVDLRYFYVGILNQLIVLS